MNWRFSQIEPQPARGVLKDSMWDSDEWLAEEKYDGDRRIAQFCGKLVRFTGRRKSVTDGLYVEKTENVPHLSGVAWPKGKMPAPPPPRVALEGTVLDGEMIYTGEGDSGGRSKFVTSIMGSLPEEAVRKQLERGWLRYVVFDCLFAKGRDLRREPLSDRRGFARDVVSQWGNPFVSIADYALDKDKREFHARVMREGGEGVVLKRWDHEYGDRQGWVKVKGEWSADVVVMGFKSAKEMSKKVTGEVSMTKYAKEGLIGAIICGQHDHTYCDHARASCEETGCFEHGCDGKTLKEVATVSGMDDDLRATLTHDSKQFIGKVIEIAHNGREPTGRFRHPRFKRFRNDKAAMDCVFDLEER